MNRVITLHSLAWMAAAALTGSSMAQSTTRVSLSSAGTQGNFPSLWGALSADGRYAAFHSTASNLVISDPNGHMPDIFLKDMQTAVCSLVSVNVGGGGADLGSILPSISKDGRYVAFESDATNLIAGDTNAVRDIFVRDLQAAVTTRVSVDSLGGQANGRSTFATISADGRYVAFESEATNLVAGDLNGVRDVFVRDRQTGTTQRVSVSALGLEGNGPSTWPAISADGRYVAYMSEASNLVPNDTNGQSDVFVLDRQTGSVTRVSVDSSGVQADLGSGKPSISGDGRVVAFGSDATNLVVGDTNGVGDVFVHLLASGSTQRVSVGASGVQTNGASFMQGNYQVSGDGRFVAFDSTASNLVPGDTNGGSDCFLYDRLTSTQTRLSVTTSGAQAGGGSRSPAISPDGRFAVFESSASNLVPGDNNLQWDVFMRDRGSASAFVAFCFGDGSGAPCGCGNEALPGSGKGCLNSLGTGATLSASGSSSIAGDDLVLSADGITNQPGLFFQGNSSIAGGKGVTFGDGIRCCGQGVVRIQIVDPPGPSQPTSISTSVSIANHPPLGTVSPGDTKCYQYWYRDPSGPCGATFNLSSALSVIWQP